jgi:hypothetical protein
MLDHHIQRAIVYKLAFTPSLRFGELKPDDLDNKLFTYHLKKVVTAGYVEKNEDGEYLLTAEGRRIGKGAFDSDSRLLDRAYSTLLLAIRRKSDGAWLLYRRRTYPMINMTGFMHAQPVADMTAEEAARSVCAAQTGLVGDFHVHGHGYFRVYRDTELESFTHFTLLVCNDTEGELMQNSELADYYWDVTPDFGATGMLPNMQTLHTMTQSPPGTFVEATFHL